MKNVELVMMAAVYITYAAVLYNLLTRLNEKVCPFVLALSIPFLPIICFGEQWKGYSTKYGIALIILGIMALMVLMVFTDEDRIDTPTAPRKPKVFRNKAITKEGTQSKTYPDE
ncbi:MAG: hypothetical protein WC770_03875 [Phycisphaerae bacterium]|jgi:hypothetical protein